MKVVVPVGQTVILPVDNFGTTLCVVVEDPAVGLQSRPLEKAPALDALEITMVVAAAKIAISFADPFQRLVRGICITLPLYGPRNRSTPTQ